MQAIKSILASFLLKNKGGKIYVALTKIAWSNFWSVLLRVFYTQATEPLGNW